MTFHQLRLLGFVAEIVNMTKRPSRTPSAAVSPKISWTSPGPTSSDIYKPLVSSKTWSSSHKCWPTEKHWITQHPTWKPGLKAGVIGHLPQILYPQLLPNQTKNQTAHPPSSSSSWRTHHHFSAAKSWGMDISYSQRISTCCTTIRYCSLQLLDRCWAQRFV